MGSREVVSDEIATKAVFEKFDPDQRKQENGKEELVKAEATKVAPNPVVDEKYAAWCEAVRRAVGELVVAAPLPTPVMVTDHWSGHGRHSVKP